MKGGWIRNPERTRTQDNISRTLNHIYYLQIRFQPIRDLNEFGEDKIEWKNSEQYNNGVIWKLKAETYLDEFTWITYLEVRITWKDP